MRIKVIDNISITVSKFNDIQPCGTAGHRIFDDPVLVIII
jgi:hypothetical protein